MTRRLYPQRFWGKKSQKKGIPADKMAEVDKRVRSLQAIADQHNLGTIHIVYDKDAPDFNVGSYMVKDEEWMERLPESQELVNFTLNQVEFMSGKRLAW